MLNAECPCDGMSETTNEPYRCTQIDDNRIEGGRDANGEYENFEKFIEMKMMCASDTNLIIRPMDSPPNFHTNRHISIVCSAQHS